MTAPRGARSFVAMSRKTIILAAAATCAGRAAAIVGNAVVCSGRRGDRLRGGPGRDRLIGGTGRGICVGGRGATASYAAVAERIDEVPPRDLLVRVGIHPGDEVLDVATGTG